MDEIIARQKKEARRIKKNAARKARRIKNIDHERERDREYREAHRAERAAKERERYWRKREAELERVRRYEELHREAILARHRAYTKVWREKRRDLVNEYANNRRALEMNSGGKVTAAEWKEVKERYGNKCLRCGRDDLRLTMDHVLPLSKGGSNTIDNIQPLCKPCNSSKRTKHIDYRETNGA